ncbi:MAG: hypothetical protein JO246_12840 [Frankiaceae bacterium]|nr:hypothetical protein [Frankiaceae bacterium]MBV9872518.1 hypothetical protein [Frankiaceae bacterium]
MATKSQRKRRAKQRRHHTNTISAAGRQRQRVDRWRDGRRTEREVNDLAFLELVLERAFVIPRTVLPYLAEQAAHALLWQPTFRVAEAALTRGGDGPAWRRLAVALDKATSDCDEFGDDPIRIAQRRMVELGVFAELKGRFADRAAS